MQGEYQTTVDLQAVVEYDFHGGSKGGRDKWGAAIEPDEDPEVEITAIWVGEHNVIASASKRTIEQLEDEILEHVINEEP